jgi:hypothetical protein
MSVSQCDDNSTSSDRRRRLNHRIPASSNGIGPGRPCHRKSHLVVLELDRDADGDRRVRQRDVANSPHAWTNENWSTKASAADDRHGKIMNCYLPEEALHLLTDEQKQAVQTKQTSHGQEYVANTEAAKAARAYVTRHDPRSLNEEQLKRLTKTELVQIARKEELPYRSKMNKAQLARTLRKHFRQPS